MQIVVEIPDDLAAQIAGDQRDLPRRLLEDVALGAYCRDAISRAELQHLLGFETGDELDGLLKQRGVEHGSYSGQDLMDDIGVLESIRDDRISDAGLVSVTPGLLTT